jgi:hypothetical protein
MPIGYIFWAIFLVIIILSFVGRYPGWAYGWVNSWVILALIFLLGWAEFGFILQGGGGHAHNF